MKATLEILVERIAAKLAELNLTEREASIDATGKPDAIRYIRTRNAMPSAERLAQLARTLNTTSTWLTGETDNDAPAERQPGPRPVALNRLTKNLPLYGTALGADVELTTADGTGVAIEQTEIHMAEPQDFLARPTSIAGRDHMYVVTVAGGSMEPRFDAGRRILVDGKRPARSGDDVIVQLRGPTHEGEEVVAVLIKQMVRQKAGGIILRQFNPAVEFELTNDRVRAVHVVVPWDDVLSF